MTLPAKTRAVLDMANMTDDRAKHMDLRDMLVREHHRRGLTELISIPTDFQLADPLTKVLAGPQTRLFRAWALRGELPPDLPVT